MTIPNDMAAKVLFKCDRTCVVCRIKSKSIQIHHVDGNNSNDDINNLAVLCLDCHNDTLIKGGFHRKLDDEQIILYRDDWYSIVSRDRINTELDKSENLTDNKIEYITTLIENFQEDEEFEFLSYLYHKLGNYKLRDKYIDKALAKGVSNGALIRLRSIQGKIESIPSKIIEEEIRTYEQREDWSQLARFYFDIGDSIKSIYYHCKYIMINIDKGKHFSAGYYLKEMETKNLKNALFELALKESFDKNDIWWQYRSLQELGWKSEIKEFVLKNRKQIEKMGSHDLKIELMKALGEKKKVKDLLIEKASSVKIARAKACK